MSDEEVMAPPIVQLCRALDYLWKAENALSHVGYWEIDSVQSQVNFLRRRLEEILPTVLREKKP